MSARGGSGRISRIAEITWPGGAWLGGAPKSISPSRETSPTPRRSRHGVAAVACTVSRPRAARLWPPVAGHVPVRAGRDAALDVAFRARRVRRVPRRHLRHPGVHDRDQRQAAEAARGVRGAQPGARRRVGAAALRDGADRRRHAGDKGRVPRNVRGRRVRRGARVLVLP
ncbi:hypothetical protein DFJ74DRAFT_675006 [Hyaloraphidium curvatum]|nr:hypothetical protein DFJ74DRAFT_675006 [Hyaloraphidium curvatum]